MPRLLHLNGPSGIGKSTVARLYADRHPGALDLDTDQLLPLIGGWREDFWATLAVGRRLAVAMAETHLRAGHDVVLPQLATALHEVEGFEAAARDAGAEYREIVLTAPKQHAFDRYSARASIMDSSTRRHIDDILAEQGGLRLLDRIHDHVAQYLALRPACTVLDTEGLDPEQTYAVVLNSLS
jgi:predicted kinase